MKRLNPRRMIVFVCEHGAAKSIVAAAYFNQIAHDVGLDLRAIARGTTPDHDLSPQAIEGLSEDGLAPTETIPQKLREADLESAERVVTFCDLPPEYPHLDVVEYWRDVPPVSENYRQARDVIVGRIRQLLKTFG